MVVKAKIKPLSSAMKTNSLPATSLVSQLLSPNIALNPSDLMIGSDVTKFNDNDYTIIDFLERRQDNYGDFAKKTKGRPCCWDVEFQIATAPSKYVTPEYLEYIKNGNFQHWSEANCDISELLYHHEGMATFDVIHIVASKIFLEYIDPKTHLLEAQVKIRPMSLADRIKKYGPFKTVVDMHDKLDIHYYFNGSLPQNKDLFDRPLTNM